MKIETQQPLYTLSGEPLLYDDSKEPITLGKVLSQIILAPRKAETTQDKLKLYVLAKRLMKDDAVEIDVADKELIKKLCETDQAFTTLVLGQILEILSA